ncbi:MAG: hypothetical protein JNJ96_05645 [Anaerolineales bacterium]|nr:hypothetical protein [Anaerolineales bacterium]HMR98680.1 hypothetical protein [Anaerolineales bacterium]
METVAAAAGARLLNLLGVVGKWDWVANGVFFGLYHIHQPRVIPSFILTGLIRASSAKPFEGMIMQQPISLNSQNRYEIKIHGQLDDTLSSWFGEAKARVETLPDDDQITTFPDVVMDQAGLVGLIRRLHGHGIVLISVIGRGDPAISKETQND